MHTSSFLSLAGLLAVPFAGAAPLPNNDLEASTVIQARENAFAATGFDSEGISLRRSEPIEVGEPIRSAKRSNSIELGEPILARENAFAATGFDSEGISAKRDLVVDADGSLQARDGILQPVAPIEPLVNSAKRSDASIHVGTPILPRENAFSATGFDSAGISARDDLVSTASIEPLVNSAKLSDTNTNVDANLPILPREDPLSGEPIGPIITG